MGKGLPNLVHRVVLPATWNPLPSPSAFVPEPIVRILLWPGKASTKFSWRCPPLLKTSLCWTGP